MLVSVLLPIDQLTLEDFVRETLAKVKIICYHGITEVKIAPDEYALTHYLKEKYFKQSSIRGRDFTSLLKSH